MTTTQEEGLKDWEKEFSKEVMTKYCNGRCYKDAHVRISEVKSFIRSLLHAKEGELREDIIGTIGAKLLARHSSQDVLDAYFEAANEELEKYETNN